MIRSFSFGGGVQSTAALVLAAQGKIDFPLFLFANVGDDSEHPDSLRYVREVAIPYGEAHGIEVVELRRVQRDGTPFRTLREDVFADNRSINVPFRMANGAAGNRNCTVEWKVKVIARHTKRMGATAAEPAVIGIGFSTDEMERIGRGNPIPHQVKEYPLIELGLSRDACQTLIAKAGLPVPGKSSCYFCPFRKPARYAEMRRDEPELFAQAVEIESAANRKRDRLGKDHVFITRYGKPLAAAVSQAQSPLFDAEGFESCDEGVCFV